MCIGVCSAAYIFGGGGCVFVFVFENPEMNKVITAQESGVIC